MKFCLFDKTHVNTEEPTTDEEQSTNSTQTRRDKQETVCSPCPPFVGDYHQILFSVFYSQPSALLMQKLPLKKASFENMRK